MRTPVTIAEYIIHNTLSSEEVSVLTESTGWAGALMRIPELWNSSQGEGIKVAVLDTGCDLTHADLQGAIIASRSFVPEEDVEDLNNHGTACSGIIAARANGVGMIGIAPRASLIIGKVLSNRGAGSMEAITMGIRWAVQQGADIISMSLGSAESTPDLSTAVHEALAKGTIIIAAAGNSGSYGINTVGYPARYGSVISIGSHDKNGNVSGFSSRGGDIDFIAPGENIISCGKSGTYVKMSGTSFATPIVAGICALILAKHRLQNSITPIRNNTEMLDHLMTIASHPGYYDAARGYGVLMPFMS